MTSKGFLTGITRHGVNKQGTSAIKRASFEQTVDILLEAAVNSELSISNGITDNIMLGQLAPLGTGNVQLILDLKKLDQNVSSIDPIFNSDTPIFHSPASDSSAISWSPSLHSSNSPSLGGFSQISQGFSPDTMSISSYGSFSPSFSPVQQYAAPSQYYSPTTPVYNPSSGAVSHAYKPMSPGYSPTSTNYAATSRAYRPMSPGYSPTSTNYAASSHAYVPGGSKSNTLYSPTYSPLSTSYNPTTPGYNPTSPSYSPKTPRFNPKPQDDKDENNK